MKSSKTRSNKPLHPAGYDDGRNLVPAAIETPRDTLEAAENPHSARDAYNARLEEMGLLFDWLHWIISERGQGECSPSAWAERVAVFALYLPRVGLAVLPAKMTQQQLAKMLGVNQSTLSRKLSLRAWMQPASSRVQFYNKAPGVHKTVKGAV